MNTYYKDLSEFLKGLDPSIDTVPNRAVLERAQGFKPYSGNLRSAVHCEEPFLNVFPYGSSPFPFPQVFRGIKETLLVDSDALYSVDENFNCIPISVVNYQTGAADTMPSHSIWEFVDMGTTWVLFNGHDVVFRDNVSFSAVNTVKVCKDVHIGTGCVFRGRMITGGFGNGGFGLGWESVLKALRTSLSADFASLPYMIDDGAIIWSSIGSSDLAFRWLLYPDEAQSGYTTVSGFDTTRTLFMEAIEKNEAGIAPLPVPGVPMRILPIGANISGVRGAVIVYGTKGVVAYIPYSEPVSTFGARKLSDVGIIGRGAVAGDDYEHIFIDKTGCVWRLNTDLELTSLGYEKYFTQEQSTIISIKAQKREQEFYLSTPSEGYILTNVGLGESTQQITSIMEKNGNFYCTAYVGGDSSKQLVTNVLDFKLRGMKSIMTVCVGADSYEKMFGSVYYRNDPKEVWRQTNWIQVNDKGEFSPCITAKFFKIAVRQLDGECSINSFGCWWQNRDVSSFRGLNATPFE